MFAFVGERRSNKAIAMRVRWTDGRLAAKTLHEALREIGIDPGSQTYLNLFRDDGPNQPTRYRLSRIRKLIRFGVTVVGMGRLVQRSLDRHGIPHIAIVHPAARGKIRGTRLYRRHVRQSLAGTLNLNGRQAERMP